jgi:ATP-dependent DNA helicase RecQ
VARGEVRPELALPARNASTRRRSKPGANKPAGTVDEEPSDSDADPELLARLKAWRTDEARRKSLPPYVIFHDRTLAAVAAAKPTVAADLARIKGIGPAKLAAYGEALLKLLA